MNDDDLVITPDEVRAVARCPFRSRVGAAAIGALLIALLSASAEPILARLDPPPPDPSACDPLDPADACAGLLPRGLATLPDAETYRALRTRDACRYFRDWLPAATTAEDVARVRDALPAWDQWARLRLDAWARGVADPGPVQVGLSLGRLGEERDWSTTLPMPPGSCDEGTRLGVDIVLDQLVPTLTADVASARRSAWDTGYRASRARWEGPTATRHRAIAHALSRVYGPLALFASLALAVGWVRLAPVPIVAGLHRLQVGRRTRSWSEVPRLEWYPVEVDLRPYGVSRHHVLRSEARTALADATARARQREASLGALDRDALQAVRDLGRRPTDPT